MSQYDALGAMLPKLKAHFTDDELALILSIEGGPSDLAAEQLIFLAASFWRQGQEAEFAECFRRSYIHDRFSELGRICVTPPGHPNHTAEVLAITRVLLRQGIGYTFVLANHVFALARLGFADEVRRLVDFERFFRRGTCTGPDGIESDIFHDALAQEIKSELTYYDRPTDRAIQLGWRNDVALRAKTPALHALRQILKKEIDRYIAALPDDPAHPFLASKPKKWRLGGWAVVSTPDSHHVSHVHGAAWLTGVYYVTQPDVSRASRRGWLEIGPPDELGPSQRTGWDSQEIEPARGSFVLMPGYFYHATKAMNIDQERICVAFEVQYDELKSGGKYG